MRMNNQQQAIDRLGVRVAALEQSESGTAFKQACGDGFDYLAIGNSITKHGLADYWWGEWGMAASEEQRDYVHLVSSALETEHGSINAAAMNFSQYEILAHDREQALSLIEPYLNEGIDLVTVQMGENVADDSTWQQDFRQLLARVKAAAPDARVLVIGVSWPDEAVETAERSAAEETNCAYIDLSSIRNEPWYQCGRSATVYGADGQTHMVEHDGVAKHPGDDGMRAIADLVLEAA